MQASKTYFTKLFGEVSKQFKVPVYQRTYDWKAVHCQKLVDDIFEAMERGKDHFTGSIVYLNEIVLSQEKIALLIDGQQRVTTFMILLKALSNKAEEMNYPEVKNRIENQFLFTDSRDFTKVFKLIPTEDDRNEYEYLLNGRIDRMNSSLGMYKNYSLMKNILDKKIKSKEDVGNFYNTILNSITFVEIALDKGIDNPQEIFESINSTGLELSNSDLVRNFLLMSALDQDRLYNHYWKPLYDQLGGENLEEFIFVFLLYKLQRKVYSKDIYTLFIELLIVG